MNIFPCVYIMASKKNGTLYIGVTSNVLRRVYEHKNDVVEGFTQQYKVHTLVFYKFFDDMEGAITYEKRLKKWKPERKIKLIENQYPEWVDLYKTLI